MAVASESRLLTSMASAPGLFRIDRSEAYCPSRLQPITQTGNAIFRASHTLRTDLRLRGYIGRIVRRLVFSPASTCRSGRRSVFSLGRTDVDQRFRNSQTAIDPCLYFDL